MRISDWSSDVCSSDLADLQERRRRPDLPQHRRHRLGDALREQRAQFGRGDEVAGAAELGGAGAVVAQARRVQRQLHEARERDGATGRGDLLADQRLQVRRSEEHTSELQSLMRISYAVFCLKKKKTTKLS